MEKINVAELLKDCLEGMELDCTLFDKVKFEKCVGDAIYIRLDGRGLFGLDKYGNCFEFPDSKCVIFPKGKFTWEGFVPPYKFTNGDIVAKDTVNGTQLFILKEDIGNGYAYCYMMLDDDGRACFGVRSFHVKRLATEEEKKRLFQAIKDNGYKWDAERKCLEELIEPKFKVGDRIQYNGSNYKPIHIIKSIVADRYIFDNDDYIKFGDEVHYSLLKFDISTLKPYKSEVLYRNTVNGYWKPAFWGAYIPEKSERHQYHDFLTTAGFAHYCIPYEGNEHLMGKQDDCSDYYKTWEE